MGCVVMLCEGANTPPSASALHTVRQFIISRWLSFCDAGDMSVLWSDTDTLMQAVVDVIFCVKDSFNYMVQYNTIQYSFIMAWQNASLQMEIKVDNSKTKEKKT